LEDWEYGVEQRTDAIVYFFKTVQTFWPFWQLFQIRKTDCSGDRCWSLWRLSGESAGLTRIVPYSSIRRCWAESQATYSSPKKAFEALCRHINWVGRCAPEEPEYVPLDIRRLVYPLGRDRSVAVLQPALNKLSEELKAEPQDPEWFDKRAEYLGC